MFCSRPPILPHMAAAAPGCPPCSVLSPDRLSPAQQLKGVYSNMSHILLGTPLQGVPIPSDQSQILTITDKTAWCLAPVNSLTPSPIMRHSSHMVPGGSLNTQSTLSPQGLCTCCPLFLRSLHGPSLTSRSRLKCPLSGEASPDLFTQYTLHPFSALLFLINLTPSDR